MQPIYSKEPSPYQLDQNYQELHHQPNVYYQNLPQQQHQQHHQHHQQQQQGEQPYLHQQQQQLYQEQQENQLVIQGMPYLLKRLLVLVQETNNCEEMLKNSQQKQEDFVIQLQYRGRLCSSSSSPNSDAFNIEKAQKELERYENFLKNEAANLNWQRRALLSNQHVIFNEVKEIQREVLEVHLPRWHHNQQLANNGAKIDESELDRIQPLVEKLTWITWKIRNQVKGLHLLITSKQNVPFPLEELDQFGVELNKSLENLILSTFVVEKQPPQVMKTNTRFTSTVRFLSGNVLNVSMINPTVRVNILSESNARAIIQRHQEMVQASWAFDSQPPTPQHQQQQQHQDTCIMSPKLNDYTVIQTNAHLSPTSQHQIYSAQQPLDTNPPPSQVSTPMVPVTNNLMIHQAVQSSSPQPFFQQQQQQQQPHQFHVQQSLTPASSTSSSASYQQHVQPNLAFFEEKVLNMSDFDPSGEILNSSNILEYQDNTGQLVCHFRNMQLKKIKRTEKKGTESVMDEKFVLLFHCVFRICAPFDSCPIPQNKCSTNSLFNQATLVYHIMAFSLPVVVIVHGNQEPHAWATVTWHNAFARRDNLLYHVPDKVSWFEMGRVLSEKFKACAGRGLSQHNLNYLGTKICRKRIDGNDILVSWNQFAKEPLPDRSFTFWEWFHSILKLTREHLRDLWNAGRIYGFVGKQGCVDLLLGSYNHEPRPIGTFLIRYSETELGGVTVAWVYTEKNQVAGKQASDEGCIQILHRNSPTNTSANVLCHLQPFVSKDLITRTLADRIRDLDQLTHLYPEVAKDQAFGAYYTPLNETASTTNGYIKPMLIQTLVTNYPKSSAASSSLSEYAPTPTTPNSMSQNSPDGIYSENTYNDSEPLFPKQEGYFNCST